MSSSRPVVVITGASSGVGRATARLFAEEGASVGLLARGLPGLEGAADDVTRVGGRALAVPTDVSRPEQVELAAEKVEAELGEIDLWVNNAMTTVFGMFDEITPEEFERATQVTYLGAVWGTRAALARMKPRDRGTIIQVGSALAYRGIPAQAAYCGAKHAIQGFTDSLRAELYAAGSSIHMGMVNLPALNTPQFSHCRSKFHRHPMPVPPIYQPEVAAEAIRLGYRERRREVNVAGPTVLTILANRLAPGLLDMYLGKTGVESQLDERPADPNNAEGNLFQPIEADEGAHGDFDGRSHSFSSMFWATRHRKSLAAAFSIAGLTTWLLARD